MTFSLAANVGLKPGREQNIAGCELELLEAPQKLRNFLASRFELEEKNGLRTLRCHPLGADL